jgi:hypothetical protein
MPDVPIHFFDRLLETEEQSRHAEMTGLGIRRRHGGKELRSVSSRQRHGVQMWTTISKEWAEMSLSVERQDIRSTTKKCRRRKRAYREGCEESRDA